MDIVTFVPKNLTPTELESIFRTASIEFYSVPSILRRIVFPPIPLLSRILFLNLLINLKFVQWPRIKRSPVLSKWLAPLKRFFKNSLLKKGESQRVRS